MEYLQGESLAQRIAKVGRLPIKLAATVAWETASAVGAAHAKGIVHRDLKPENLFLSRDPSAPGVEKVKVLDFGIAKLHASPSQISTQTGAVMGTPVYMSPEQCRGARDEVDHRTDIYSLGVILYEMLAGKPPFQGEAFGDLLLRHMTEAPAPLGPLNPEVPAFLEEVVMRALAKRREDRFSSMRELQKGLSGATEGLAPDNTPAPFDVRRPARTLTPPIMARTPAITRDLGSRRRGWLVGGGLVLLLGITGLVVSRANRTPAPAVVARPAPATAPRVEPLPAPPPPDASPAATTASPTEASPPHATSRPAGSPSDKKRGNRKKIDVKQW
jgi:serine/threonine-protein kinase